MGRVRGVRWSTRCAGFWMDHCREIFRPFSARCSRRATSSPLPSSKGLGGGSGTPVCVGRSRRPGWQFVCTQPSSVPWATAGLRASLARQEGPPRRLPLGQSGPPLSVPGVAGRFASGPIRPAPLTSPAWRSPKSAKRSACTPLRKEEPGAWTMRGGLPRQNAGTASLTNPTPQGSPCL
jgi:hypothetical protein